MRIRTLAFLAALIVPLTILLTACSGEPASSGSTPSVSSSTVARDPEKTYAFSMQEVEVPSRSTTITALLTLPDGEEGEVFPIVVMNHSFAGDRDEQGGFTALSEELARRGIASIRMDFTGRGTSPEPPEKSNLFDMETDCMSVLTYALTRPEIDPTQTGVLGYEMGGRVAIECAADPNQPFKAMALLGPSVEPGQEYLNRYLGGQQETDRLMAGAFTEQRYVEYTEADGTVQLLGDLWFDDLLRSAPLERLPSFTGDLLVVYGKDDAIAPPETVKQVREAATGAASIQEKELPDIGGDFGFGIGAEVQTVTVQLIADFFDQSLRIS